MLTSLKTEPLNTTKVLLLGHYLTKVPFLEE
jgi:hypothetical protein